MRTSFAVATLALVQALTLSACIGDEDSLDKEGLEEQVVDAGDHGVVEFELGESTVRGHYYHAEGEVRFEAEQFEASSMVTLELRGMILLLTADVETGAFEVDGFAADNGLDTQMSEADRALLQDFDRALGEVLLERDEPALGLLVRSLTLFGDYSSTLPLQRSFYGRLDRSSNLCSSVNKPGQGAGTKKYVSATHDCSSGAGDCSNWWGCERWDDNASTDKVLMSMHPDGGCSDETYFGGSATSLSCTEPNHPGGTEYAYGGCFGRCGGGCGSGTQFTRDCVDHDQCVRLGHSIASFWCNDELVGATWDAVNANNCSGVNLDVDYNWAGSSNEGNCSMTWKDSNDGCDHGCQFVDGDCFR